MLMWAGIAFLVLILLYFLIAYFYAKPVPIDILPSAISLNTVTPLLSSNQANGSLLTGAGSTFCGLFNVTMGNRTANMNTSSFTMLVGVQNAIEFQLAPSSAGSTARLVVGTSGPPEIINLPPFPLQKWVFLTLLRDGRRFDVLYDNQIVASHRLAQYPTAIVSPLQVGGPTFVGQVIHATHAPYRLSPDEVAVLRATYTDATGAPTPPSPFPYTFNIPNFLTFCIPGVPCNPIMKPPTNNRMSWTTPYN